MVENVSAMQETRVPSLGQADFLEKGMATHTSILAWKNPLDRRAWWAIVQGVAKSRTWLILYLFKLDLSWWLGELASLLLILMPLVETAVWVLAHSLRVSPPPHGQEGILWASDRVDVPLQKLPPCHWLERPQARRCWGDPSAEHRLCSLHRAREGALTRASSGATMSWALRQKPLSSRAARRSSLTLNLYPLVFYWPVHLLLWPNVLRITVTEPSEFRQPVTCIQTS